MFLNPLVPIPFSIQRCVAPHFRRHVIISVHKQTIYKFFRDLAALFLCEASFLGRQVLPSPAPEIKDIPPDTWFHKAFMSPLTCDVTLSSKISEDFRNFIRRARQVSLRNKPAHAGNIELSFKEEKVNFTTHYITVPWLPVGQRIGEIIFQMSLQSKTAITDIKCN